MKRPNLRLLIIILLIISPSVFSQEPYTEIFRPQYHFSPLSGWIGDPDGLVRYNNKYHLFWWGHAISEDLVYWKEKAWPMPSSTFDYYSGSAVIDKFNTAGFQTGTNPPMIAIITNHNATADVDGPALAFSNELGTDYSYFNLYNSGSPLMTPSLGFRDPSVFWDTNSNQWIMVIAKSDQAKVLFYRSSNLKAWQLINSFSSSVIKGWWECPDLFQLPIDGNSNNKRWVLIIGVSGKTRYFIGNFNSQTGFQVDTGYDVDLLADFGSDFYAARTYRDYDNVENRTVIMAWLGNWEYANLTPTSWGRGVQSIPRELSLRTTNSGLRLCQKPIQEFRKLRMDTVLLTNKEFQNLQTVTEFTPNYNYYEIDASFQVSSGTNFGINLCANNSNRKVVISYDVSSSTLYLDRTKSGNVSFSSSFPNIVSAPLKTSNGIIKLHIFIDQSSIEIFANNGEIVMSSLIFPYPSNKLIQLFSENGTTILKSFSAYNLKSIWKTSPTSSLAIPDNSGNNISIYPNPIYAGEDIHIDILPAYNTYQNIKVNLRSIAGQLLFEEMIDESNPILHTSNLSPGLYLITISNGYLTKNSILIVK